MEPVRVTIATQWSIHCNSSLLPETERNYRLIDKIILTHTYRISLHRVSWVLGEPSVSCAHGDGMAVVCSSEWAGSREGEAAA